MWSRATRLLVGLLPVVVLGTPSLADAQTRSIFSVLDTQGRSVAPAMAADGELSEQDVLSAGGRRVQVWSLSAAPGSNVQVDLRSSDFDSFLYVVGPGLGEGLRDDDSGDGLNSRLCLSLDEVGEYRLVASSLSGGTGAFTLAVSEISGDTNGTCANAGRADEITDISALPTEGRVLTWDDEVEGVLGADDPVVFESPAQAWAVEGQQGASFSVDLRSDAFDAYLMVQGPGLDEWLDDDDGAGRCDSRITFDFPETGTYRVVVSTLDAFGGPFALSAAREPGPASTEGCIAPAYSGDDVERTSDVNDVADVGDLSYDVEATGTMTASDGEYAGRSLQGWTFEGTAGDRVAIELRSADFDSYLYMYGPGFDEPLSDDDGAGNLHSRICAELPESGRYRVMAGPLSQQSGGGRYTLSVTGEAESLCGTFSVSPELVAERLAALPTEGRTLSVGEERRSSLDASTERHPESGKRIQPWSLVVEAGRTVYVDVVSEEFDPLIYAVGSPLDGALYVDDAGDGCNTRAEIRAVRSGTVTLLPGAFYEQGSGSFLIRATTDPPLLESGGCIAADGADAGGTSVATSSDPGAIAGVTSGAARVIQIGTEVEGTLTLAEERIPGGQPAQPWTVVANAGDEIVVELLSEDFDPVLYVDGGGLSAPLMDDDGAGNLDSRIAHTVTVGGPVRIVVTALNADGSGTFRLRVIRRVR